MTDRFTKAERSRIMSKISGKDTQPEKIVRSLLQSMGHRFRLHVGKLPGKPDIVLPARQKIILVHGCFWHGHRGCSRATRPATRVEFWNRKIDGNMKRDTQIARRLRALGWDVLTVWQCQIRKRELLEKKLLEFMNDQESKRRKRAG